MSTSSTSRRSDAGDVGDHRTTTSGSPAAMLGRHAQAHAQSAIAGEASRWTRPRAGAQGRPDVVFLDIQMPRAPASSCSRSRRRRVVFVTAPDVHHPRIEVNALDYLLKPVHRRGSPSRSAACSPPPTAAPRGGQARADESPS